MKKVMTITPKPEQERVLTAAIEAGLIKSADDAFDIAVETLQARLAVAGKSETAEQWIRRFHAWTDSHAGQTVVLSDEAMSRESIYGDRGL
jgi:hypothetical protein